MGGLWPQFSPGAVAGVAYQRITHNRITLAFFILSIAHFLLQVIFQGHSLRTDDVALTRIQQIIAVNNAKELRFAVIRDGSLMLCTTLRRDTCQVISTSTSDRSSDSSPTTAFPTLTTARVPPSNTGNVQPNGNGSPVAPNPPPDRQDRDGPGGGGRGRDEPEGRGRESPDPLGLDGENVNGNRGGENERETEGRGEGGRPEDREDSDRPRPNKRMVGNMSPHLARRRALLPRQTAPNGSPRIPSSCAIGLNWPRENLENARREDGALIGLHFWSFIISAVAIFNASVAHVFASFLLNFFLVIWSAVHLADTRNLHTLYNNVVVDALCNGFDPITNHWQNRAGIAVPILILNLVIFALSGFLGWKLMKTYDQEWLKKIGEDRKALKTYKVVVTFLSLLQLALFWIFAAFALAVTTVSRRELIELSRNPNLYQGIYISVLLLIVPWIMIGDKAANVFNRALMLGFLLFNVGLVVGWGLTFSSNAVVHIFSQWAFFSFAQVTALLVILGTLGFGIWSRLNFDVRLEEYRTSRPTSLWTPREHFASVLVRSDVFTDRPPTLYSVATLEEKRKNRLSEESYGNALYVGPAIYPTDDDLHATSHLRESSMFDEKDLDYYAGRQSTYVASNGAGVADRVVFWGRESVASSPGLLRNGPRKSVPIPTPPHQLSPSPPPPAIIKPMKISGLAMATKRFGKLVSRGGQPSSTVWSRDTSLIPESGNDERPPPRIRYDV